MSQYKKFAGNVGIVALATIITGLEGFLLIPILTKTLGPANYGIWSQVKLTLVLIGPLALFGLDSALIRFLTGKEDKNELSKGYCTILCTITILSIAMSVLLFILANQLSQLLLQTTAAAPYFQFSSILLFLRGIYGVIRSPLRFKERYFSFSSTNVILSFLNIGFVAYFVFKGYGLFGAILGFIIAQTILIVYAFILTKKTYKFTYPRISKLKKYLSYGLPLTFVPFLRWAFQVGDQYILGYFYGAEIVGIYATVYSLAYLLRTMATPVLVILTTSLTKAYVQKDFKAYNTYFKYSYKYIMLIVIPAAFGISILARPVLLSMSSKEFIAGQNILPILSFGLLLFTFFPLAATLLRLEKKTTTVRNMFFTLASANILLNLILIPRYDLIGAAIATLATFICSAVYSINIIRKRKLSLLPKFLLKAIACSSIMAIIVWFLKNNLQTTLPNILAIICIGILVYFTLMFLTKSFKKEELKFFRSIIAK